MVHSQSYISPRKPKYPKTFYYTLFFFPNSLIWGVRWWIIQKKLKKMNFVHFLIFLMVREWIYVDVDRPRFQEKNYTTVSTDHLVQFLNGFAIFHTCQGTHEVWKIAKKPNHIVKFGCGNDCVKLYFFFRKWDFFLQKIVKKTKKMIKIFFLSKKYTLVPKLSYMFYEKYFMK